MGVRVARLRFRVVNLLEQARLRLFVPRRHHDFFIVTTVHDGRSTIERNLDAILAQRYDAARVTHLIIDDVSSDGTPERIERWLERHRPPHRVELVRNDRRLHGCANYTRGFRRAPAGSVVLQVDGDDWLPDGEVLPYLNMVYHDPEVWMTYNSWVRPDGQPALNHAIPEEIVRANRLRECRWISSHLHTFRASLFSHVRDEDLIDPETGDFWRSSVDQAHYLPMLELSGGHARHLPRATYVYNRHEGSIIIAMPEAQAACARRIRQLPRYKPLARLD